MLKTHFVVDQNVSEKTVSQALEALEEITEVPAKYNRGMSCMQMVNRDISIEEREIESFLAEFGPCFAEFECENSEPFNCFTLTL